MVSRTRSTFSFLYLVLFVVMIAGAPSRGSAQGDITTPSSSVPNPLDPNLDGFITNNTNGPGGVPGLFTSALLEEAEFELAWNPYPLPDDPSGDNQGAACGEGDIVNGQAGGKNSFAYYMLQNPDGIPLSGDERLLFRLRVAKIASGGFGYSVLFDTDGAFGQGIDPNAVSGNLGFELEVRLDINAGVVVEDVDGTVNGAVVASYPGYSNFHIAKAMDRDASCGPIKKKDYPVFYDFWVLLTDLGVTASDPIRMVPVSSNIGNSVLGGNATDIGGIDDTQIANQDSLFTYLMEEYSPHPLPVELLNFSAKVIFNKIELSWQTASEVNSHYFIVERSLDAESFNEIERIPAAGNSSQLRNYACEDLYTSEGTIYYRLTMVDKDGSSSYSDMIAVLTAAASSEKVMLYPNPVQQGLNLQVGFSDIRYAEIHDALGQVVVIEGNGDADLLAIDTSELPPGIYLIRAFSSRGETSAGRICVIR